MTLQPFLMILREENFKRLRFSSYWQAEKHTKPLNFGKNAKNTVFFALVSLSFSHDDVILLQLHELFRTLSGSDESDSKEPLPPSNFLGAVGKLNPMFEGNQQQVLISS